MIICPQLSLHATSGLPIAAHFIGRMRYALAFRPIRRRFALDALHKRCVLPEVFRTGGLRRKGFSYSQIIL